MEESKEKILMLSDYYKWSFCRDDEKEGFINVEGIGEMEYEMTLSPSVRDDECMRVLIDGKYYHFG